MSRISYLIHEIANMALIPLCFRVGGKATPPPTIANIFLTKKCNSRCKICEYWKTSNFSDELETKDWFKVIDSLKILGVKMISFTADGEILTRKDAFEIMHHADKLGFLISINTNGLILDRFIKQIIELNPLQIQISLDVFDDASYKKVRGVPNGFRKVKNNILALKAGGYERISVGSVLIKDNLNDLLKLQDFCLENGFTYRVTAFQFEGFGVDNRKQREAYREAKFLFRLREIANKLSKRPMNNTPFYLKAMENYYTEDKYHPLDCIVGIYKIFILPTGDVSLCNIMHENAIVGNVNKNSLSDIWFGKKANEIRNKIKEKKCPSCWLSCFAEDNIRFSPLFFFKNAAYFLKKSLRLFG